MGPSFLQCLIVEHIGMATIVVEYVGSSYKRFKKIKLVRKIIPLKLSV